ncbi:hypothetical protein [Granulicella sp. L60]|uniref:hypothetical protein n=1 Tax=Granulicella sp. L60 TaxID=1641866 RepID=UPI00131D1BD1|nr:hypothetical protein [Granulicella sp. L60]
MQQQRVESTDKLPSDAVFGHDLVAGLKFLRAPVTLFKMNQLQISTLHERDPQQRVAPKDLHQALRYGIPTTLQTETSTEIRSIIAWIEGKFNEGN